MIIMSELKIKVGDRIRIKQLPPYIKTADPMPMLRPANILTIGEEGIIVKANPAGYWSIRFSQGTYLLEPKYFELLR
jgi:hypothetical protein